MNNIIETLMSKLGTQIVAEIRNSPSFKSISLTFKRDDTQEHYLVFQNKLVHIYYDNMDLIEEECIIVKSDFDNIFKGLDLGGFLL